MTDDCYNSEAQEASALAFGYDGHMSATECQTSGVLAEVNRRLLHPRGLAMYVNIGSDRIGIYRSDDPEGFYYEGIPPEMLDERRASFDALLCPEREAALGYVVQPIEEP